VEDDDDINHLLHDARTAIADWRSSDYLSEQEQRCSVSFITAFEALDARLSQGGDLPADWDVSN
jgi:hypothetical protein